MTLETEPAEAPLLFSDKAVRRFLCKVDQRGDDECWGWLGAARPYGAPIFWFDGQARPAQDFSYQLAYGSLPDGYAARPLCDNRGCMNPAHLGAEWSPWRWGQL